MSVRHTVFNNALKDSFDGMEKIIVGLGCFWGAERKFWQAPGVVSTSVGYMGGRKADPTYQEVCTGQTGHAEVVRVVFDPARTSYKEMLHVFWGNHDPTQVDRQGNDVGTQYRSCLFFFDAKQEEIARASAAAFEKRLQEKGKGKIATEFLDANKHTYYYAEDYHQQYLDKNKGGYCGIKGTGCYEPTDINDLA